MAPTWLGMGHLPKPAKSVSLERDFRSQTKTGAWPVGPGTTRMARREATCHKKWLREAPSSSLSGSLCLATLQEAWVSRFGGSANLHTPEAQVFFPAGAHTPACLLSSLGSYPCSPGPPWCPCPLLMSPPPTALLCSSPLPLWETPQTECWNTCPMPPFRTSVSPHVQPGRGTRSYFLGSVVPLMPWASWPSAVSGSVGPVQGSTPPDVMSPHRGPTCR